jgi:hypothetical protein
VRLAESGWLRRSGTGQASCPTAWDGRAEEELHDRTDAASHPCPAGARASVLDGRGARATGEPMPELRSTSTAILGAGPIADAIREAFYAPE